MQRRYTPPPTIADNEINRHLTVQSSYAADQQDCLYPDKADCSWYPWNIDQAVWNLIMVIFTYLLIVTLYVFVSLLYFDFDTATEEGEGIY